MWNLCYAMHPGGCAVLFPICVVLFVGGCVDIGHILLQSQI